MQPRLEPSSRGSVQGLGFLGFEISSSGFRAALLRFRASGFRVSGFGFRVSGFKFLGFRLRASGFRASGFRVSDFGFRVSGFGLPGLDGNANSHGARPVHRIITMPKWIRSGRLSIQNSLPGLDDRGLGGRPIV